MGSEREESPPLSSSDRSSHFLFSPLPPLGALTTQATKNRTFHEFKTALDLDHAVHEVSRDQNDVNVVGNSFLYFPRLTV